MPTVWDAIKYVGSGLALVAFLAAVLASIAQSKIEQKRKLIETAPEEDRAQLVSDALEFFHVDTKNLTREQRFQLALVQVDARLRRFRITSAFWLLAAILLTILAFYAIKASRPPERHENEVHIAQPQVSDALGQVTIGQNRGYIEQDRILGVPVANTPVSEQEIWAADILLSDQYGADGRTNTVAHATNNIEEEDEEYFKKYFAFATYKDSRYTYIVRYDQLTNESSAILLEASSRPPNCQPSDLRQFKPLLHLLPKSRPLCLGSTLSEFLDNGASIRNPEGIPDAKVICFGLGHSSLLTTSRFTLTCYSPNPVDFSDSSHGYYVQVGTGGPERDDASGRIAFDERVTDAGEGEKLNGNYDSFKARFGKVPINYIAVFAYL